MLLFGFVYFATKLRIFLVNQFLSDRKLVSPQKIIFPIVVGQFACPAFFPTDAGDFLLYLGRNGPRAVAILIIALAAEKEDEALLDVPLLAAGYVFVEVYHAAGVFCDAVLAVHFTLACLDGWAHGVDTHDVDGRALGVLTDQPTQALLVQWAFAVEAMQVMG